MWITVFAVSLTLHLSRPINAQSCTNNIVGDADCSGKADLVDYEIWRREYLTIEPPTRANFDKVGAKPDLVDYELWRRAFLGIGTNPPPPANPPPANPPPANPPPANPPPPATNYQANLQMIRQHPGRNTLNDNSPFANTPSAQLNNQSALFTTASEYFEGSFPDPGAGSFRAECEFSHFAYDDPIVYPNQPGKAHLHAFFGNKDINAYSTQDTILNSGSSTCNGAELNRTAYWMPAMFDNAGNVRIPSKIVVYYKVHQQGIGRAQAFPDGLRMVKNNNDPFYYSFGTPDFGPFYCSNIYNGAKSNLSLTIPSCPVAPDGFTGALRLHLAYDYCWNGQDPANYLANMARGQGFWYSNNCPSSHSRVLPNIQYRIFYNLKSGDDTSKWFLASDVNPQTRTLSAAPGSTWHADWWGGWNRSVMDEWVRNCNNVAGADCGNGALVNIVNNQNGGGRALKKIANGFYERNGNVVNAIQLHTALCPNGPRAATSQQAAYCNP